MQVSPAYYYGISSGTLPPLPPLPMPGALVGASASASSSIGGMDGAETAYPVQSVRLSNGAMGHFLQSPDPAHSVVTIAVPVGDLPPSTTNLLLHMLREGSDTTKRMLSQLGNQAITVFGVPNGDNLLMVAHGPAGQEPVLAQTLLRMLTQPIVDPAEFNRIKTRGLQSLQGALNDPDDLLSTRMRQRIYGPNHPFALATSTCMRQVAGQDLSGLMGRLQGLLQSPDSAKILMVSPLPAAQQQQIVNDAIQGSGWYRSPYAGMAGAAQSLPLPTASGVRGLMLMPTQAIDQALIKTIWKAPDVRDPDYPAYRVLLDFMHSENPGALYQTMRQDHGLVYSVELRDGTPLAAGKCLNINVEVAPDKIGPALNDIQTCTQAVCRTPVSPAILDTLKRSALRETRMKMQDARDISGGYWDWLAYDTPLPDPKWLQNAIMRVTPADVQRVANRVFNAPGGMQWMGVTAPAAVLQKWFPGQPLTAPVP